MPEGDAAFLDPTQQADPVVSPRTALAALENPEHISLEVAISLVQGLATNVRNQERERAVEQEDSAAVRQSLTDRVNELSDKLRRWESTYSHPPEGFIPINGHFPSLTIPIGRGIFRPPMFVQLLENGKIAMLPENGLGLPVVPHIADVQATPKLNSTTPYEPMPAWFRQLLVGSADAFYTLRRASKELEDWGIEADIVRFRNLNDELGQHSIQLNAVQAQIDSVKHAMAQTQARLEGAQAHQQLGHFEGLAMAHSRLEHRVAWTRAREYTSTG